MSSKSSNRSNHLASRDSAADEQRRDVLRILAAGAVLGSLPGAAGAAQPATQGSAHAHHDHDMGKKIRVGMLVHPDMVLLDLVGPQTTLNLAMTEIHLLWKDLTPVSTDVRTLITPTTSFKDCPDDLDVLFVPGGLKGTVAIMNDPAVLEFLADKGKRARYVTGVCTGTLALAAAGLLQGYRATSHWYVRDLLPLMGATLDPKRVVVDRNRMTGGGVTAGIDFGLTLASRLRDEEFARRIQLTIEYDPEPPFQAGSPERAPEAAVHLKERRGQLIGAAREAALKAGKRLGV